MLLFRNHARDKLNAEAACLKEETALLKEEKARIEAENARLRAENNGVKVRTQQDINRYFSMRDVISDELIRNRENWTHVELLQLTGNRWDKRFRGRLITDRAEREELLNRKFDNGFGSSDGGHFVMWTKKHIYFPVGYDGSYSVHSIPRDPDSTLMPPELGGGW